LIVDEGLPEYRQKQGWSVPKHVEDLTVVVAPDRRARAELAIEGSSSDDVNIFSGFHAYTGVSEAFGKLSETPSFLGVLTESVDDRGVAGWLRSSRNRRRVRSMRAQLDAVFAIGPQALAQCKRSCGRVPLIKFAYFVDPSVVDDHSDGTDRRDSLEIVFCGRLVGLKGVDVLLRALAQLDSGSWSLSAVGDGPDRSRLLALADELEVSSSITWHGTLDRDVALAHISRGDVLALPSRYDGWGVAVNEALMLGLAVVVSDAAGSACLVTGSQHGMVIKSGDEFALADAIRELANGVQVLRGERLPRLIDARSRISPDAGARYFLQSLAAIRAGNSYPTPPWQLD
jgi:glycosyltransferase involved in cell wall biosynthesis